jgi:hypothetical protein
MSRMLRRSNGSWLTGNEVLPKHQHKIMLCLAKYGAMNMSQTNRKVYGQNTSTTRAFHELKKKGLITEIGAKAYHGRQFPEYWLTGRGLAYIFLNMIVIPHDAITIKGKASLNSKTTFSLKSDTIEHYASLYLKDKTIETYLKLRSASNRIANLLDYSMFRFGSLNFEEMASYLVSTVNYYGKDEALNFIELTKLPEEFYAELKHNLEETKRFLDVITKLREK